MTRKDHLLVILGEECAEVAQRASKALRFGIREVQKGSAPSGAAFAPNDERLLGELDDLLTAAKMLVDAGVLPRMPAPTEAKEAQVEKYFARSTEMGRLDG